MKVTGFCLIVTLAASFSDASVIKNSLEDPANEWSGPGPTTLVVSGGVIRNCGCHLLSSLSSAVAVGRRNLPRSANRNEICNTFCVHLSGSHFSTTREECLCFTRPPAIDCEEVETAKATVLELKCVDRRPAQPSPTRRNTVSQSVLTFLRSIPRAMPDGHGAGSLALDDELSQYDEEVQRPSRHIASTAVNGGSEKVRTAVAAASSPAYKTSTSFGPSKSVGLAATLILLAFICIFTMGLKTWYHKRRKDQKEKEEPVPEVKKDIDWEKIMSY